MVSSSLRGRTLAIAQIALVVAPCFIIFGYNQAGIGGLLSLPSWTSTFPALDTTNTTGATKSKNASIQGLVISSFVLGALAGCFGCIYLGDILGRRKSIFVGGMFTLVGQALCASSNSMAQLIIGRGSIGVAIGIFSSVVPVWQAECSPPAKRGQQVILSGIFISLGYTIVSWTNLATSQLKGSNPTIAWRLPLALPIIFSVILLSSIFFMPESPRWLVLRGRDEDAAKTLSQIKDLPIDDPEIVFEINSMRVACGATSKKAKLSDMLTMGPEKLFYRFCLCIMIQFYQQMSGANLISVYAPVIFEQNLGLHGRMARILTGGTLTWKFISSFVAFFTIDRYGRRPLFIISGIGMGSCMLILGITTGCDKNNTVAAYISVITIFMYNFFVPVGFLGANFLYCAEVAPVSLRVAMASISTANHWLWNFVVVISSPVAIASIGHWYFFLFASIGLSIPLAVWFLFPETKGLTLEEIELAFAQNDSFRDVVKSSLVIKKVKKDDDNVEDINEKMAGNSLGRGNSHSSHI